MFLVKLFKKLFYRDSVKNILIEFHDAIDRLEAIAAKEKAKIQTSEEEIAAKIKAHEEEIATKIKAKDASLAHAEKAVQVAANLAALVCK